MTTIKLWVSIAWTWLRTRFAGPALTPAACPKCGKLDMVAPPKRERVVRVMPGNVEQTIGSRYYCLRCRIPLGVLKWGEVIPATAQGPQQLAGGQDVRPRAKTLQGEPRWTAPS